MMESLCRLESHPFPLVVKAISPLGTGCGPCTGLDVSEGGALASWYLRPQQSMECKMLISPLNLCYIRLYLKYVLSSWASKTLFPGYQAFDLMANRKLKCKETKVAAQYPGERSPAHSNTLPKQLPGSRLNGYNFVATNFPSDSKEGLRNKMQVAKERAF